MNHKISFRLAIILIIVCIMIIPTYVNAAAPGVNASVSEIDQYVTKNDISNIPMTTLSRWKSTCGSAGYTPQALGIILEEVKSRLASSSISVSDIYLGLDIIGDTDTLQASTLQNLQDKLSTQNVPGNTTGQNAYSKVTESLNKRTTSGSGNGGAQIDPTKDPVYYKPGEENSTKLSEIGRKILAVINIVGVVISVVALGIIGLRYMFGSIEEKAQYKETMVPYIIGLILLGGGSTIINIIYNIASKIGS